MPICLCLFLTFCLAFPSLSRAQAGDPLLFIREIEAAHGSTAWNRQHGARALFEFTIEGRARVSGELVINPGATQVRFLGEDAVMAVFDGRTAWLHPESADWDDVRADLIGWAYWWALPHKLQDPGARLEPVGQEEWDGKTYDVAVLTFDEGTGDTPDDRYRLYQDPGTGRLEVVVVQPVGKMKGVALRYEDFREVETIPVPHRWRFFDWLPETGLGKPVGEVNLRDVHFDRPAQDAFDPIPGGRQISSSSLIPRRL